VQVPWGGSRCGLRVCDRRRQDALRFLVEQLHSALNIFADIPQHLASARGIDVQLVGTPDALRPAFVCTRSKSMHDLCCLDTLELDGIDALYVVANDHLDRKPTQPRLGFVLRYLVTAPMPTRRCGLRRDLGQRRQRARVAERAVDAGDLMGRMAVNPISRRDRNGPGDASPSVVGYNLEPMAPVLPFPRRSSLPSLPIALGAVAAAVIGSAATTTYMN